jgi:hypothetical protein
MKVFIETSSIIGPLSIAKFDYPSLIGYVTTNVIHSSYPPKLQFGPSSDTKSIGGLVATQLVCSIFNLVSWSPPNSCDRLPTFLSARPHWNPKKAILFLTATGCKDIAEVPRQSAFLEQALRPSCCHRALPWLQRIRPKDSVSNHIKPTWP